VGAPRVVVVGLGPAGADLLLPAARATLARIETRFARTSRHPAVDDLAAEGVAFESLDGCYESAPTIERAYEAIVDVLVEAAGRDGEIAYAVPGSPVVAERTTELLRERDVDVEVVPGLSFVDLAWSRLGLDPLHGTRVVDAHEFDRSVAGHAGRLLVAQCDTPLVVSDVKLTLLEHVDAGTPITVLQRLGAADERISVVALEDLDREIDPDHLTSLFVDTGEVAVGGELAALYALVERLRAPGGCPWDAAQTHHSLARHALEEAYEVVEAIERLPVDAPADGEAIGEAEEADYARLADELGDLLFQVFIHAVLASEAGAFTIGEVAAGIHEKLVRRHPHVFGSVVADSPDAVITNWEQIKKSERGSSSIVADMPDGLPSLLYAAKLVRKAESVGLSVGDLVTDARGAAAALARWPDAPPDDPAAAVGDVLAAVALAGRTLGVDGEVALRSWAARLRSRFAAFEAAAAAAGIDLTAADPADVVALWTETAVR
jgi:tetrapyrrole methylase family protein/MazG family protein